MKILIKENENKTILSYSERINEMLSILESGIAEMKKYDGMYDSSSFVLKLINFRNGVDDLINDLAYTSVWEEKTMQTAAVIGGCFCVCLSVLL